MQFETIELTVENGPEYVKNNKALDWTPYKEISTLLVWEEAEKLRSDQYLKKPAQVTLVEVLRYERNRGTEFAETVYFIKEDVLIDLLEIFDLNKFDLDDFISKGTGSPGLKKWAYEELMDLRKQMNIQP